MFGKKKKEQTQKKIPIGQDVVVIEDINSLFSKKNSRCPEVLVTTQSCFCINCPRKDKCSFEAMAKSAGCLHSFVLYCSVRNQDLKAESKWPEIVLRDWSEELARKFNIKGMHIEIREINQEREALNGPKETEGRSRTAECSADTE